MSNTLSIFIGVTQLLSQTRQCILRYLIVNLFMSSARELSSSIYKCELDRKFGYLMTMYSILKCIVLTTLKNKPLHQLILTYI